MIVAGIGCRRDVSAADVAAALDWALCEAGLTSRDLGCIATAAAKCDETGISDTAAARGVRFVLVSPSDLVAAGRRCVSHSDSAMAAVGVPSVAEAAALAVAGNQGRLLMPRIVRGAVTCALVKTEEDASVRQRRCGKS